jgi:hypothetical protein
LRHLLGLLVLDLVQQQRLEVEQLLEEWPSLLGPLQDVTGQSAYPRIFKTELIGKKSLSSSKS